MQGSKHSFSSIYTALIKIFSVSKIAYSKPSKKIYSSFSLPASKPPAVKFSFYLFADDTKLLNADKNLNSLEKMVDKELVRV